jgi:hypothetical protein
MRTLLLCLLALLAYSCQSPPVPRQAYRATLPPANVKAVRLYVQKTHLNSRATFVTMSWVGFFNGGATYLSSTVTYPAKFASYPIAWTYVDSSLVVIYDSRYKNYFADSIGLKAELNQEFDKLRLEKTGKDYVEDPLPLRFITTWTTQKIDTSYLNLKLCY